MIGFILCILESIYKYSNLLLYLSNRNLFMMAEGNKLAWLSENILSCSLCLEQLKDPKSLPCLHTYCLECLQKYISSRNFVNNFPCPLCNKETAIPGNEVENFPSNFSVISMIAYLHQQKKDDVETQIEQFELSDKTVCNVCEGEVKLENLCSICQMWLCNNCTKAHQKFPATRGHDLTSNKEINEVCKSKANKIQKDILQIETNLMEKVEILNNAKEDILKQSESMKQKIISKAQSIHEAVDEQAKNLTEQVDRFYRTDEQLLSGLLSTANDASLAMKDVLSLIDNIKVSDDGQTSQMLLKMVNDCYNDRVQIVDELSKKNYENSTLNFQEYQELVKIGDLLESK